MRSFFIAALSAMIIALSMGCKSGDKGPQTFCDTACLKDSIKFVGDHKLAPYVYITASSCMSDSIAWSYKGMGINKKIDIEGLIKRPAHLQPGFVKCFFKDTAFAWLIFNDCATGRGYQIKLPFNKTANIDRRSGGINSTDPKFSITDGLIANTDRGNIFVEEISTGKQAQMTFGEDIGVEFDIIHEYIDSVKITSTHIWAKIKIKDQWVIKEKDIELK